MDYLENDKIIITGSWGYLGKRIVLKLRKNKIKFITLGKKKSKIKCNLLNKKKTIKVLNFYNQKLLIHCAANVPKKSSDYNNSLKNKQNLTMFNNILSSKTKKMIFISSVAVYGNEKIGRETIIKKKGKNLYAAYKIKSERNGFKKRDKKFLVLRLPGLFGANRKNGIIYNTIKKIKLNKKINFSGQFPKWHSMHVDDAADVISFYTKSKDFGLKEVFYRVSERFKASKVCLEPI